ncbi:hypothetical protein ACJMQP_23760 [Rhodopseudomonas palustris]
MKVLVEELRQRAVGETIETCDLYQQSLQIDGEAFWALLQEVRRDADQLGISVSVTSAEQFDDYELLDDEFDSLPEKLVSIRFIKSPVPSVLRFFTIEGFCREISAQPDRFEAVDRIMVAELDFEERTDGLVVGPWLDDAAVSASRKQEVLPTPRRLVNDMSGKGLVPSNVRTWMLRDESVWLKDRISQIAINRLALCLPDALSVDSEKGLLAHLRSGRKVEAHIDDLASWADTSLVAILSEVCEWIYLEGRDAETRHSLLSAELVRLWRTNATWQVGLKEGLEGAFATAKTAYRLHVLSKGVDALKLMSDLRKGLSEDVRSLANNSASLSSGLWRDAAVAFGVVVVRLSTASVGDWLIWMAVVYLIASCIFSCVAASDAVNGIIENEVSFRSRLYGPLLLEKEYEELAGKHYRMAALRFYRYRVLIVVAYIAVISSLICISNSGINSVESLLRLVSIVK